MNTLRDIFAVIGVWFFLSAVLVGAWAGVEALLRRYR